MKTKNTYILLLTALYFVVSFIGILHHEFFIDEAHHWLLARDSASVHELFINTRIEGHPLIWSLLLYAITRFTTDPFWMQLLHILISTATVVLFLKKAPFSWLFKILFIFGYFMIFEYNLISRNYILGVFFLFLACSIFENRKKRFNWVCIFLALAANIHLMFSIIAFALFLTLLVENLQKDSFSSRQHLIGYLIFGLGISSIIIQIQYTDSTWLLDPINAMPIQERLVIGFGSLFKGLVVIPDFRTLYFWNSNFIVNTCRPLAGVLAILIYFLPLLLFFKNRKTLFFVYTALVGAQIFFFITQRAATRFQGMTYIIIIMALWIEKSYDLETFKLKDFLNRLQLTLWRKPIIYSILIIQFCSGIYAYTMDYRYPFTSGKETVDFLKKEKLDQKEIVTSTCDGTILSAYLERKIWFLCDGSYQSFCHWNAGCVEIGKPNMTAEFLINYMNSHKDAIFVSYYPIAYDLHENIWMPLNRNIRFRLLKKFDLNMVDKTYYYVFEVSKI